ncbi:cytochrome bd-type quinol oxidase subunit 2 [Arthrobacter pigmenti]|uniref:Cytochrome bd-type quinol oxidase subunit 2 n=1 Tax=Arthrobacter pigmenti TaxID=271432 RepID=A0A846RTU5_9MICC|nr:hypothetical protein [Arthrobacter pigmenti]NJC23944.1 cytochrome bd-type quinol oxidase subunit 2 [Arthrobacter pigmenti]
MASNEDSVWTDTPVKSEGKADGGAHKDSARVSARKSARRAGRAVVVTAAVVGVLYWVGSTSSAGGCAGGVDAGAGFVDANGNAIAGVPPCISITTLPLVTVVLLIAALPVLFTLWVSARERSARSVRVAGLATALAIIAVALVHLVPIYAYYATDPISTWFETGHLQSPPAWIGAQVEISPME